MRFISLIIISLFLAVNADAQWIDNHPNKDSILWFADHEDCDILQWIDGGAARYPTGGHFNNEPPEENISKATSDQAHSGVCSMEHTILNVNGIGHGTRSFRWGDKAWDQSGDFFPQMFWASTWMFIPKPRATTAGWYNVMQLKSKRDGGSKPVWTLNLNCDGEKCNSYFYSKEQIVRGGRFPKAYPHNISNPYLPIGEWFHLEMFVNQGPAPNTDEGVLDLWINGEHVTHHENIRTRVDDHARWSINNYTEKIEGGQATLYYDDAVVSTKPMHVALNTPAPPMCEEPLPCPDCPPTVICPDPVPCPDCPEPEPVPCEDTVPFKIVMGEYEVNLVGSRTEPCPVD